jgi:hypothetical protein
VNRKTSEAVSAMTKKAAATPPLSVVPPDARAPKKDEPKNITEALAGSGRDVLVAMRKALAKKLDADEIASNSIASSYKELRELDRLIRLADREAAEAEGDAEGADVDDSYDASAV